MRFPATSKQKRIVDEKIGYLVDNILDIYVVPSDDHRVTPRICVEYMKDGTKYRTTLSQVGGGRPNRA